MIWSLALVWWQDFLFLLPWFLLSFSLSFLGTMLVKKLAWLWKIIDQPNCLRKFHLKPTPLLGGWSIYLALGLTVAIILLSSNYLTAGEISWQHYFGFFLGGLVLMIGGFLDDKYSLPPKLTIIFPILASLIVIYFGIEVEKITNPFGGILYLSAWQSALLVFGWLMVVMYTTKFLDGLDGLATGVSAIGSLMIMLLSLTVAFFQPDVALLSAVALAALLGFLIFNFHPASIFLGESGSTFVGFLIGVLAVISGGKLATALLVIGIPLIDVVFVVTSRIIRKGWRAAIQGDRSHLHHRLLTLGFSEKGVVVFYYALATVFGTLTLFLQSKQKFIALCLLVFITVLLAISLTIKEGKKVDKNNGNL